jgi:probable rRNA maturation factor
MRVLNREYRGIDRTTDVLSFPQQGGTMPPCETSTATTGTENTGDPVPGDILGDIVINLHQTKRQAAEYGVPFQTELKKLLVHGLLHLIGYDHLKSMQKSSMKKKERALLRKL